MSRSKVGDLFTLVIMWKEDTERRSGFQHAKYIFWHQNNGSFALFLRIGAQAQGRHVTCKSEHFLYSCIFRQHKVETTDLVYSYVYLFMYKAGDEILL